MRTLLISDLHLGSLLARDVLRRPEALAALEAQVARADRLVLLGDTLELLDGRPDEALNVAESVLPRLAGALGPSGQLVIVPGNHDHALVRPWVRQRIESGRPIAPASRVPRSSSALLGALCALASPARVEVRYPGLWVAPGIYATHGHYVDRHLIAALSALLPGPHPRDDTPRRLSTLDYERSLGADSGSLQELLATTLPEPLAGAAAAALAGTRRALISAVPLLGSPGLRGASAVWASLLDHGHARRGALPAMAEVASQLRLRADAIIFGHIHRRGPLSGDAPGLWRPGGGRGPRLLNTGCWVWDPALAGSGTGARPYRPGGAVLIEDGRAPRALDLLAGVPDAVLAARG